MPEVSGAEKSFWEFSGIPETSNQYSNFERASKLFNIFSLNCLIVNSSCLKPFTAHLSFVKNLY